MFLLKCWRFHPVLLVWVHVSTLIFKQPHIIGAVRFGEWGGHGTSTKREITCCRNQRRSSVMLISAVWAVAPFVETASYGVVEPFELEIRWSLLCNVAMWLWWFVRLHHQRRAVFSGVRTEDGRSGGFFHTTDPSRRTLPIDGLHWRWGFLSIHFAAKSVLSRCNGCRPNKQFHSTHTFSNSPTLSVD